jgi:TP901 family phage tail tape measure protein
MAQDRVVKVTLTAQMQNYLAGMEKARKVTAEAASEADRLAATREAFDRLGRASLAAGGLIAVGLAVAVKRFADFDQAMSNVAATGDDARANIDALREAAIDAGASTVFSAEESANAIENLAKAGLSASDILGGALTGSLDLAAAGELGVAEAGEIAATTLQQFGLAGSEAVHVADLLAAGAGKAMGDVDDMAQALKQAGLVANQFGIPVEEATGALAAFANQGLLGSDAGTSLRTMLLRLANPTEEVKELMAELGFSAYDASGQFVGLEGLAGELEKALAGMTDQQRQATLAMIFGQDAIRAATILYDEGAAGIASWVEKVDDSGYAAETARTKLDNLKGDVEALGGAFDSALISMGAAADGPLRFLVQSLTELVDSFNDLPDGAKQAVFWIGTLAATGATALGAYLLLVPKVAEFRAALDVLGPSAQRASRAVATIGKGAGLTALLATTVTLAAKALTEYARQVRGTDDAVAKATTTNQRFLDAMESLGVTTDASAEKVTRALDAIASGNVLGSVGTEVLELRDSLAELDEGMSALPIDAAADKFQAWTRELGLTEAQAATLLDEMPKLRDAIRQHLTATGEAADNQAILNFLLEDTPEKVGPAAGAIEDVAGASEEAAENLDDMRAALSAVNQEALTMSGAVDAAQGALNDMAKAAEEDEVSIDGLNDASIDFRDSIRDVEQAHRDAAEAIIENGGSLDDARGKYQEGRDAIIEMLKAKGLDEQAAKKWADTNLGKAGEVEGAIRDLANAVNQIPPKKTITLVADTAPAMAAINDFVFSQNGRRINLVVDGYVGRQVHGSDVIARAGGGAVYGPGTSKSDSIPAMLSNGEHVLTAADVAAMGGQNAVYAFRQSLHSGGGPAPVSLDGMAITGRLEIGGDGLATLIDGRIVQAERGRNQFENAGVRKWGV